jgi:hypothetical protein
LCAGSPVHVRAFDPDNPFYNDGPAANLSSA